jgi:hypothetical protein
MNKNLSKIDKWARICVGLGIIGLGLYYKSIWGIIGLYFLATAIIDSCPIYTAFKYSTCKKIAVKATAKKKKK